MKKRKELDALVPNGKLKKKSGGSGGGGNSSSGASHELLRGDDSDSTDTEEFSVLQPQKFGMMKKGGWFSGLCGACVPLCTLTLVTACVVGSGTLVWMQFGMRQEVDILRDHVQKVEETSRGMPNEFHSIHSQINELQKNQTSLKDDVNHISLTIDSMAKEIEALKKTAAGLQKSVAEAPQLESLPKDVDSLLKSLASMGSKITDVETNLGLVKTQLIDSDKNKQHNQEELAALKKRLDEFAPVQNPVIGDSKGVMAHIDSEITKVGEVISESNSSIWDKLQWAVNDLHDHHDKIAKVEEAVQNLTNRIALISSSNITPISTAGLNDNLEHVQALVNDTVVSVIHHYLPEYFPPLLTVDGAVAYPALVQYIRNLTGLYVALVANANRLPSSSPLLNDTYLDLNVTSLVIKSVRQEINSSSFLQQAVIQKLNTSLGNLWKMYYAMLNDSEVVDAKLYHLQQSLEILRPSLAEGKMATSTASVAPPASPAVAAAVSLPSDRVAAAAATTKASTQSTLPRSTNPSDAAALPSLPQATPISSLAPPAAVVQPAAVTSLPPRAANSSAPLVVAGSGPVVVVVNVTAATAVNGTSPTVMGGGTLPANGTVAVAANGTVLSGNGTSTGGHIPKPSMTGGSLNHPEYRPDEPVEN